MKCCWVSKLPISSCCKQEQRYEWVKENKLGYHNLHQADGPPLCTCTYSHRCILYTVLCMCRAFFFYAAVIYYMVLSLYACASTAVAVITHIRITYHITWIHTCIYFVYRLRWTPLFYRVMYVACADRRLYNMYLRSLCISSLAVDLSVLIDWLL